MARKPPKGKSLAEVNTELAKQWPAMYVSKYVCDTKTNWGIVNNNS